METHLQRMKIRQNQIFTTKSTRGTKLISQKCLEQNRFIDLWGKTLALRERREKKERERIRRLRDMRG